jgi:dTDP-4-dehydrorhamnose 3,5-epimerase
MAVASGTPFACGTFFGASGTSRATSGWRLREVCRRIHASLDNRIPIRSLSRICARISRGRAIESRLKLNSSFTNRLFVATLLGDGRALAEEIDRMNVLDTSFLEVKILVPTKHADERGFFSETYSRRTLTNAGIELEFVQDNHAFSTRSGTVRGLHFQVPPFAQDKIVRVIRGAIFDVVVDVRRRSPTFGRFETFELYAADWKQLLIPKGFAHGLCTLEPDTEIMYKVSNFYSPEHDKGVRWNDPAIGITWPVTPETALTSPKDRALPLLSNIPNYFDAP